MKYATGRGTRVKHSTGLDTTKLDEIRRRIKRLKHSTGGESPMIHATGKEMDYKYEYEEMLEEEEKLLEQEQLEAEISSK